MLHKIRSFVLHCTSIMVFTLLLQPQLFGANSYRPLPQYLAQQVSALRFPDDFKWCVATAAYQIEGNDIYSDWWAWEHLPPKCTPNEDFKQNLNPDNQQCTCTIKNCEKSGLATNHWNLVKEDTKLIKNIGAKQYRMSVEWAKIEPTEGEFNSEATQHYKEEVDYLITEGIEPIITLHHFTFPKWLQDKGGWTYEKTPELFERFALHVFKNIAPNVTKWVTVNEPLVHLGMGYFLGVAPPGIPESGLVKIKLLSDTPTFGGQQPNIENIKFIVKPLVGLLKSHTTAYFALKDEAEAQSKEIKVGIAHHLRVFDPVNNWNPTHSAATRIIDNLWNWTVPEAIRTGVLRLSLPGIIDVNEPIEGLKGTEDFFGVNYYTRDIVRVVTKLSGIDIRIEVKVGAPLNDMGWEIYPEGFYRILKQIHARYPKQDIYVTENGTADAIDDFRSEFLINHLSAMNKAVMEGVPVKNYCHWSLLDNFEWIHGREPRFGLYETNYETFERTLRRSGRVFQSIATK